MGTWGDRFKRFADGLSDAVRSDPSALAEQLRNAASDLRLSGGVLYIPRRTMGSDPPDLRGSTGAWPLDLTSSIEIGDRVELVFAPGAALLPVARADVAAELVIRGKITASRASIFGPASLARSVWPGMPADRRPARVRLLSTAVERVHPEWWGAGAGVPDDDTRALQAAFHAAHRDRRDGDAWLPPLVVELSGTYDLMAPLLVGDADAAPTALNPGVFELNGIPDRVTESNLRCDPSFSGEAMIVVHGVGHTRLDEVRFDGRGAPRSCVMLGIRNADAARTGASHHLRRCAFRGATEQLLRVERDDPDAGGAASGANAVLVEGCSFSPSTRMDGGMVSAARLRTSPTLGVEFRSTSFDGVASAMIHATSTAVSLTHCSFRNGGLPASLVTTGSLDGLHDRGPEGGVDVFLDAFDRSAPASLSAMHCASRSVQFLVTRGEGLKDGHDSTIVGLHHDVRPTEAMASLRLEDPPLLYRPREPDKFEPTPVITAPPPGKSVSAAVPGVVKTFDAVKITATSAQVAPNSAVAINASAAVNAKNAAVEITGSAPLDKSSALGVKSAGVAALSPDSLAQSIAPDVIGSSGFLPRTTALPPLEGRWITASGQFLPLPPIIDWDGVAQGGNGLSLCGCRLDRPHPERTAAIVGRNLTRPIFDLGVLWGDPNNEDPLFSVATAEGGASGLSTTSRESRPVGPDVRR